MVAALAMHPSVGFLAPGSNGQACKHSLHNPQEEVVTLSTDGGAGLAGTMSAAVQMEHLLFIALSLGS